MYIYYFRIFALIIYMYTHFYRCINARNSKCDASHRYFYLYICILISFCIYMYVCMYVCMYACM